MNDETEAMTPWELGALLGEVVADHLDAEREPYAGVSRWHASDVKGCWRARWYKAQGIEPDTLPSAPGTLILHTGNLIHGAVQGALAALGAEVEVGWRDEEISLGGRADAVVREPIDGLVAEEAVPLCIEIKTMSDYGFRKAGRAGGPDDRHLAQMLLEGHYTEAVWGWVVAVSRDSGKLLAWEFPVHEGTARREREGIIEHDTPVRPARRIPEVGTVADPMAPDAPWQCRYCAFRTRCAKDGA